MITRRAALGSLLAGVHSSSGGATSPPDRPNIVLIYIDDLGWKDLACTGSTYHLTPRIDQLAAGGMMFTRGYAGAPLCSPSRGALLSGKYPARTKLTTVWDSGEQPPDERLLEVSKPILARMIARGNAQVTEGRNRHALPRSEYTFAQALRDSGYVTAHFGKWHLGLQPGFRPQERGFSVAAGYWKTLEGPSGHFGKDFAGKLAGMENLKDDEYVADALTGSAVEFLRAHSGKPFALMLSHYAVHSPIKAKPADIEFFRRLPASDHDNPIYAAMVKSVDDSVGRVLDALSETGLERNTVVIFTSDNGGLTPITSNYPLLGGKSLGYEAGLRVPWIVKWPGKVKQGSLENTPVLQMDLYPTFLEMAGIARNPRQQLDGVSLMPLLTSAGRLAERPLFFHFPSYTGYTGPFSSVIHRDWKLIRYYNDSDGRHQLFDLKSDPYELRDLVSQRPDKERELSRLLDAFLRDCDAELPLANAAYDPAKRTTVGKHFPYGVSLRHRSDAEKRLQESLLK
ncbi:MAG: sulfatase [Acidobacteria bacterium]|nr:sulfatase [Acidobacteriota bacterium]